MSNLIPHWSCPFKDQYSGYIYYIDCFIGSIVATPGRFLHIMMEMELKLTSVEYVVFDEADRYEFSKKNHWSAQCWEIANKNLMLCGKI